MLPRFEIVRRMRPVDLVAPGSVRVDTSSAATVAMPAVAPYVAAVSDIDGPACEVALHLGGLRLAAVWRGEEVSLSVDDRPVRSRRFARGQSPSRLGISLTGTHLTAWADESGSWVARARYDLVDDLDPRDESVLAGLAVEARGTATHAGGFGQLGLRDVRVVSDADGTPIREGGDLWLTATTAGPGFFDTAHTSVWRLDPTTFELAHSGDLFFRRPDRPGVFGDHATHLVRARRRVAGGDQHVGRLRGALDARWSAYGIGVAGHPRRVRGRPAARHPRPGHPRAAAPDGRVRARSRSGTRTWCSVTGSGWSAS